MSGVFRPSNFLLMENSLPAPVSLPLWRSGSLASIASDMTVRVWNVDNGVCVAVLRGHTRGISDVSWAPDSLHLASASDDTLIHLWVLPMTVASTEAPLELEPSKTLRGHSNYVFCVEFGPTGGTLASGSFDESVRFWDVREGKVGAGGGGRAVAAHADPVTSVAFGPDGSILASCSYDGLM